MLGQVRGCGGQRARAAGSVAAHFVLQEVRDDQARPWEGESFVGTEAHSHIDDVSTTSAAQVDGGGLSSKTGDFP